MNESPVPTSVQAGMGTITLNRPEAIQRFGNEEALRFGGDREP